MTRVGMVLLAACGVIVALVAGAVALSIGTSKVHVINRSNHVAADVSVIIKTSTSMDKWGSSRVAPGERRDFELDDWHGREGAVAVEIQMEAETRLVVCGELEPAGYEYLFEISALGEAKCTLKGLAAWGWEWG